MNTVYYEHLGSMEYGDAWNLQEALMAKAIAVKTAKFKNPDDPIAQEVIQHHLLTVRHPHVYTLGKSGSIAHLLLDDAKMESINATFYKTNRGGDITYHGPGQLVAYPVLDLEQFYTDLGRYMRNLEEVIIKTIGQFGIEGTRLEGATGVWIDIENQPRKICAMGVKCSRWITIHGLALNMNTNLDYFGHIVPCGISDKGVTSMEKELGQKVDESIVEKVFLEKFAEIFEVDIVNK